MNADLSTECVLRRIVDEARTLVGSEVASVFLVDTSRQELYSTVNSTGEELRVPITCGIAGHVASTGEPLIIPDAYSDPRFNKAVDMKTGFRTRNIMCVPMKVKNGNVIGVAQLINKTDQASWLLTACAQTQAHT
jgi:signal transduction protein with GAF and PtsI domain